MAAEYRLKDLFQARPNEWITLKEIMDLRIGQYNRCISDLRHKKKMKILNNTQLVNGVVHSCYKYVTVEFDESGQGVLC